jgi:hypothetical protein
MTLAQRVAVLEAKVARLCAEKAAEDERPWFQQISGAFANDPIYDEAMRLGREYRESLRPKARKTRKRLKRRPESQK